MSSPGEAPAAARQVPGGLWVRSCEVRDDAVGIDVSADGQRWWRLSSVLAAAEPVGGPHVPGAQADLLFELVGGPLGPVGLVLAIRDGRPVVGAPLLDEPPARLRSPWAEWLGVLGAELCPRKLLARSEVANADLLQLSTAMGALADPERVAAVGPVVPVLHGLARWRHLDGNHPNQLQEE